jgi:hypothetical protein
VFELDLDMLISAEKRKGIFPIRKRRDLVIIYIYICLWLIAKKNSYVLGCYSVA